MIKTEGLVPSGSYSANLREVCEGVTAMSVNPGAKQGRPQPSIPTAKEIGRKRTMEFLGEMFQSPPKSRRLEIASEIKKLETERERVANRIRKAHERMRDLAKALEDDETRRAGLEQQIRTLKNNIAC